MMVTKGRGENEMSGDGAKTSKMAMQMSSQKTPSKETRKRDTRGRKQFGKILF